MPTNPKNEFGRSEYSRAYSQLSSLLNAGASWSGRERNCCFLNTKGKRFADVSALSGLDFPDDGRAVAIVDWDHDGDLDVWTTNRTGPQIRLLRNEVGNRRNFIAVKLQGVTCNRNAIGARVTVHLEDGSKRIRSLRAGEGFLGQSSKWIHFGLDKAQAISKLEVAWPSGESETFPNIAVNQRFRVRQGSGTVEPVAARTDRLVLAPGTSPQPKSAANARVVLTDRLPLPQLSFNYMRNEPAPAMMLGKAPTLINLWASWCQPCLVELREFVENKEALDAAGLSIVALCVDPLDGKSQEGAAVRVLDKLAFNHPAALANQGTVDRLQILAQDALIGSAGMPVPTSFLVDRHGRLAIVYKGAIGVSQILDDLEVLEAERESLRDYATAFPGRWNRPPQTATAYMMAAARFRNKGMEREANEIVRSQLAYYQSQEKPAFAEKAQEMIALMASRLNDQAKQLVQSGNRRGAQQAFREALKLDPTYAPAHSDLGVLLMLEGRVEQALTRFRRAIQYDPSLIEAYGNLAQAHLERQEFKEAIEAYRKGRKQAPGIRSLKLELAWLLSVVNQDDLRDAAEAISLVESVDREQVAESARYWDVLAAALANAGRYEDAVQAAEKAMAKAGTSAQRDAIMARRDRYAARQPFRLP